MLSLLSPIVPSLIAPQLTFIDCTIGFALSSNGIS